MTASGPKTQSERVPESLRRGAIFAFAVQLSGTFFTAILTLYLVRTLPRSDYGNFAIALAVGAIVVLPSDFGVSSSAARFVAESFGDRQQTVRVIAAALRLKTAASTLVGLTIFFAASPIADAYGEPGLVTPLRWIALAVTAQSLFALAFSLFTALRQMRTVLSIVAFESAAEMVATVLLVWLGTGVVGATAGRAVGYVSGAAIGLVLLARQYGGSTIVRTRLDHSLAKAIGRYAGAVAVVDAIWATLSQLDVLIMGALLSAPAVASFQAPARLLLLATYPGTALANAFGPRVASSQHTSETGEGVAAAIRRLIIVQAFAAALVASYADVLVDIALGRRYDGGPAVSVLRVMSLYVLMSGLAPLLSATIDYVGGARRRIPIAAATLGVNITINLLLLTRIGPVAAAFAVDAGYLVFVGGHALLATRLLTFDLRSVLRSAAVAILAASLMAGAITFVRAIHQGIATAIVAGIVGSVAFVVTVNAAGESSVRLEFGRNKSQ